MQELDKLYSAEKFKTEEEAEEDIDSSDKDTVRLNPFVPPKKMTMKH